MNTQGSVERHQSDHWAQQIPTSPINLQHPLSTKHDLILCSPLTATAEKSFFTVTNNLKNIYLQLL